MLTRDQLVALVRGAVEPLAAVQALWEGGSTSFSRADDFSDVDLCVVVPDRGEQVEQVFAAVESALARSAPVELCYRIPEPAWHGHSQRFYRFAAAPAWLLLDLAVMTPGRDLLVQPEVHGAPRVLFDRGGILAAIPPLPAASAEAIGARVRDLATRFDMFQILVSKELWRKHPLDAIHFYRSLTLAPLVELVRIAYDPTRAHFGGRYLHTVLPPELAARLTRLSYVGSFAELDAAHAEATAWFRELASKF